MLSVIEKQRKKETQAAEEEQPNRDMSGELQTIPARHAVATFVPRGRTIKIINTYGKQVVSTWAFSLAAPPEQDEDEEESEDEGELVEKARGLYEEVEGGKGKEKAEKPEKPEEVEKAAKDIEKPKDDAKDVKSEEGESSKKSEGKPEEKNENTQHSTKETETTEEGPKEEYEDPPEQAPDTPDNEKTTESTAEGKKPAKRTWGSYLPSIPYRSKASSSNAQAKPDSKAEKAQNDETSKKWSSYLPTGKSFSSYVPNVQVPDSKAVVSAFQASHYRDPNKSYAEQLYDFSKTPVGAGSIAGQHNPLLRKCLFEITALTFYSGNRQWHRVLYLRRILCLH